MALDRLSNITKSGLGSVHTYDVGGVVSTGVITATAFVGDISQATGAAAGLGTALSEDLSSPLNKIYYTNQILSVDSTVTVNPPDSSNIAYTQYAEIAVEDGYDLIVEDGDDLIPDILGLSTVTATPLSGAGGRIRADQFTNKAGTGAPTFTSGLNVSGGNVGIGTDNPTNKLSILVGNETDLGSGSNGLRIYDGTKNVQLTRTGSTYSYGGVTGTGSLIYSYDKLSLHADTSNPIIFSTGGSERLRVTGIGSVGIGQNDPEVLLHLSETNADPYNTVITHLKLNNSGGNGGSGSRIELKTGAARCWIQSFIDGANSNSGGALVFGTPSTGTLGTERMRIDSVGRITTPAQPAFCASNQNGNQPTSTHTVPVFNTTFFNVGGHFNASNSRFTAPVTGTYLFTGHIIPRGLAQNTTFELWISVISSTVSTNRRFLDRRKKIESDTNTFSVGGSVTIQLTAGDQVYLETTSASYSDETNCKFSGFLVG